MKPVIRRLALLPLTVTLALTLSVVACNDSSSPTSVAAITTDGSSGSLSWVYYNGVFDWQGDWSSGLTPNYSDTTGVPIEGLYDIAATVTSAYGLWLPYFNALCNNDTQADEALCFNVAPYNYFVFSIEPTVADQSLQMAFAAFISDEQDGTWVTNLVSYCTPALAVGVWSNCKVPLSAFGLTQPLIRKFSIQDETGLASNLFYLDNVGFTAN